jgi:FAD:protein FMN transferase
MMLYHEFRAMNSDILFAAEGDQVQIGFGFQETQALIDELEARFTRFSADSELSQLNCAAGSWFEASEDLYDLMQQAQRYFEQSGGLFDPSILPALQMAGYDKSMDEIRAHGVSTHEYGEKPNKMNFGAIQFDPASSGIFLPEGMQVDLGGIAKGWIAEIAAQRLACYAKVCAVNAGGDMFLIGIPEGETAWEVALEDPRDPSNTLAVLSVGPGALATSSVTKRRWQLDGQVKHHLIDPRSGEPAETEWLSVTVVTPHAAGAEVFAKTLLLAGPQDAMALASRGNDIIFVAVDSEGKLWGSDNSQELLK